VAAARLIFKMAIARSRTRNAHKTAGRIPKIHTLCKIAPTWAFRKLVVYRVRALSAVLSFSQLTAGPKWKHLGASRPAEFVL